MIKTDHKGRKEVKASFQEEIVMSSGVKYIVDIEIGLFQKSWLPFSHQGIGITTVSLTTLSIFNATRLPTCLWELQVRK